MMSEKVFRWLAVAVVCSLLPAAGCSSRLMVTVSSTGAGSVVAPGEGSFVYGLGSVQRVVAKADPNYHFVNWRGTAVDAGKVAEPAAADTTVEMDADYTLEANFAIDQHLLTMSSASGGSVSSPGEGAFRYDHGSLQRIVATADPGYRFVNWTGTAVSAGMVADPKAADTTVTMDADYALQAAYEKMSGELLALKFTAGRSTSYRLIAERKKSVEFEGSLSRDPSFKGGETSDRIEMDFTQQIESVNEQSNAVAKITITGLKYFSKEKDATILDFDSSRDQDRNSALAKLVGQSYTIEIAPDGRVVRVVDVKRAQAAVAGRTSDYGIASALLQPDAVKGRHAIPGLPPADKNQLNTGDEWSRLRTFSFGMFGPKSYEKIYMLKEIKDVGARRIATVEMNAIPTSEVAEELRQAQVTAPLPDMFDTFETYTGQLKLDLTAGKVEKYVEQFLSDWVIVDPSAKPEADKAPDSVKMTASRLDSLERID